MQISKQYSQYNSVHRAMSAWQRTSPTRNCRPKQRRHRENQSERSRCRGSAAWCILHVSHVFGLRCIYRQSDLCDDSFPQRTLCENRAWRGMEFLFLFSPLVCLFYFDFAFLLHCTFSLWHLFLNKHCITRAIIPNCELCLSLRYRSWMHVCVWCACDKCRMKWEKRKRKKKETAWARVRPTIVWF